jgi:hypothetical protein
MRVRAGLLLSCFAATALAGDWRHFLGPTYQGTSSETGLRRDWAQDGPQKLWEHAKGAGHSTPAIGAGKVVLFHSSAGKETVEAVDAATGAQLWQFTYDAPYESEYGGGSGPKTNPTIADGRVFALGVTSWLHGLDLATGKVLWRRELARQYRLLPTFFGHGGTPLVVGDKLIVSMGTRDGKSVIAFDAATGREIWTAKHAWGSSYSSPVPAVLHGRECVLALQGGMDDPPTGGLLVIDAADGRVLSATPHRAKMFASATVSSPVGDGNRIFIAEAYTEGGLCLEIAPDFSVREAWRAPKFDTYLVTAIPHEGYFYAFAGMHQRTAELACYEIATGREMWRDDLGGKYQRGSLLRVDGLFLCLGENGDLAWLDLTPKGATAKAQTKLFHAPETWTPPVVSDGRLFICQNGPGSDGTKPRLICYDLRRP